MVDGLTDAGDIAHLFASRYRDLYTSVPYNIDEMQVILNSIDNTITGWHVNFEGLYFYCIRGRGCSLVT